jgi:hypothetical protein
MARLAREIRLLQLDNFHASHLVLARGVPVAHWNSGYRAQTGQTWRADDR